MDEQVISNGCPMLRKKTYSIEEVLSLVPEYVGIVKKRKIDFDGDEIYIDSLRYFTFKKDNCTCTSCGLKGSFFAKEKFPNDKRYHLNLYAIDKDGNPLIVEGNGKTQFLGQQITDEVGKRKDLERLINYKKLKKQNKTKEKWELPVNN